MGRVSPPLAAVLRAERERFNAMVAEARLLGGGFAEEAFVAALTGPIDALAGATARVEPDATAAVVDAAYRAALALTGRGEVLRDRTDASAGGPAGAPERGGPGQVLTGGTGLAGLWAVLPGMAAHVAERPDVVIASLCNATVAVRDGPGTTDAWLRRLVALGRAAADADQLLAAGRVAAWVCGLAHHRDTALQVASTLPDTLLGLACTAGEVPLDGWQPAQRWSAPVPLPPGPSGLVSGRRTGGFRGLGGPFTAIPRVWVDGGGQLHVSAAPDDGVWRLHADAFGTTLTRADPATTAAGPGDVGAWPATGDPRPLASAAASSDTLAWTTPHSYRIAVAGRPPQ